MAILTANADYIFLAALALGILAAVLFAVIAAAKYGKKEDEKEFNPQAEYDGVDGFKAEVKTASTDVECKSADEATVKTEQVPSAADTVAESKAESVADSKVEKTESQSANQPIQSASIEKAQTETDVKATAPQPQISQQNIISAESVPVEQRQGDWSNYDGEYDGYYYDPIDVCYYEGNPPANIQKMYLPAAPVPAVKTVKSSSAPIDSKPKAKRAELKAPQQGAMDVASIYGQYVIEHEGNEFFFTLYSNKGEALYESYNYASEQFCRDALKRFKKDVLTGAFSVDGDTNKFHFVLTKKLDVYYGPDRETRADADGSISTLKYFAQTDIINAQ